MSNEEWVAELYRAILGRPGDWNGVQYWVNMLNAGIHTQGSAYDSFIKSPEAAKAFTVRITDSYRRLAGREPDAAGLAYHLSRLQNGDYGPEQAHIDEYLMQYPEFRDYKTPDTSPGAGPVGGGVQGTPETDIGNPANPAASPTDAQAAADAAATAAAELKADQHIAAQIEMILKRYDLVELMPWVLQQIDLDLPESGIMLDLYNQPKFKERFPAIDQWALETRPPSPEDYMQFESTVASMFQAAGLPKGFYDQTSDFTDFILRGISPAQLSARVTQGFQRAMAAPPEVRARYAQFFGPQGDAALASAFLDPERSLVALELELATAEVSGFGQIYGLNVGQQRALDLAELGYNGQNSQQGFQRVNAQGALFNESISEEQDLTKEKEGIDAAFATNQDSADVLERRRAGRVNNLRGGGGLLITEKGIGGSSDS